MNRSTVALIAALVLSVSVNLLVLGTIIGHNVAHRGKPMAERSADRRADGRMHAGAEASPQLPMDSVLYAVPCDLRPKVRKRLETDRAEVRDQVGKVREARRTAAEALSARPFDAAAADAALSALRAELDGSQRRLHAAVVAVMAEAQSEGPLPPSERRCNR